MTGHGYHPPMRRRGRGSVGLGLLLWAAAATGAGWAAAQRKDEVAPAAARIARWAGSPTRRVEALLAGPLAAGDPVVLGAPGGGAAGPAVVGRVAAIRSGTTWARATWEVAPVTTHLVALELDPEATALLPAGPHRYATRWTPKDGRWILETLLPPAKRAKVVAELDRFLVAHEAEVQAFLRPLAEEVVAHGMGVLEANLSPALERRRDEIQALLDAHRVQVKDDLVPVLKRRLGPSAKRKAEPILTEVGRELWDALPMWSLGWSAFVDRIPGTSRDRMDRWWREFLDTKAIPIVAAHEADLLRALEELVDEGARDPEVRAALSRATKRLADDPKFRALVRGVLEEALVRPFDLRGLVTRLLDDPAHRARLARLEQAIAPTLQRIGRELTVDPESGRIDPDLARVLRRVVFEKDARWVELVPADGP